MLLDKITLDKALQLESTGEIFIYDIGEDIKYHPSAGRWQDNFTLLRTKARHLLPQKIAEHFNTRYLIEIPQKINNHTMSWKYLRGIDNTGNIHNDTTQDIEYVYALTNPGYPELVKIGMTRNTPPYRVNQINGTGTVDLWEVRFALPVRQGCAMRIEQQVHKYFKDSRLHIRHENDREMFKIDIFVAIDKIREVGSMFQAGKPILY